jgi:hypothetical protein
MNLLMVTSKVNQENAADLQAALEKLIRALEKAQPEGVRYAAAKLSDGVTFLGFLQMEPAQEHPLQTFPEYAELLEKLEPWRAEPATADHMTVLGSYRLF